jgi:GDP-L-fucose synthase
MQKNDKIFVAGHRGLVGSAIVRCLAKSGYDNLLLKDRNELDLENQASVRAFFEREKPSYVFLAAAKVGGIMANSTLPAEFIFNNILIQVNTIDAAWRFNVKKLLFLGSSCIYPRECPQPIKEEYLLTGPLEKTNEPYAIAKIAGIKMCEAYNTQYKTNFVSVMPTNLYGPEDNFDLQSSHVLPALIRKVHEAKKAGASSVTVWGTGKPKREFLHVDDLAEACVFVMRSQITEMVNIGSGVDVSIEEVARIICKVVGYKGELVFDTTKPDGTPRKLLDVSRLRNYGWESKINLADGVADAYKWFLASKYASLGAKP